MRYLCKSKRHEETMISAASSDEAAVEFARLCRITGELSVSVRPEGGALAERFLVEADVRYHVSVD